MATSGMNKKRHSQRDRLKDKERRKRNRKNTLMMDFDIFADYAEKLDKLGADLKEIFGAAMEEAAEKVQEDTRKALESEHLPAKGIYRTQAHETENSVIRDVKPKWRGDLGTVDLGFDKTKPGAGGWLITGTPKMSPDKELNQIYVGRKYATDLTKNIQKRLQKELNERMANNGG